MEQQGQQKGKHGTRQACRCGLMVMLVVVGLGLLWLMVRQREVALTKISDLQPAISSALVRVEGKAAGPAQVSRDAGKINGLRFEVDDGTGKLAVTADAQQAQQLARWDRVPRAGDAVVVTGRLRISANANMSLQLPSDTALKLRRQTDRRSAVLPETGVTRPAVVPSSSNGGARLLRP